MARIVLIEDSPTDRAVFTQWLRRAGHEVLEADNAEDGLQPPQPASYWSSEGTTFPARVQLCSCSSLITSLTPTPLPNFSSEVTFYFIL